MKLLTEFDYKKATQAINFLAKKEGGKIDKLKLMKLIYFAERYHLRKYGRPITNDTYWAMPYGPVASSAKDIAACTEFLAEEERDYAKQYLVCDPALYAVESVADVDQDIFSDSEIESLNFAYENFGKYGKGTLVDITHRYPEWKKHENLLGSKEITRVQMSYSDFFNNPNDSRPDVFELDEKTLKNSKEMFDEEYAISECWK
jgi:uncharacterized phage-associated protein